MGAKDCASRPHIVYEVWAGQRCLYIGQTCRLRDRLTTHGIDRWVPAVTEVRTTECANQSEAMELERKRVREENPERNTALLVRSQKQQLAEMLYEREGGDLPAVVREGVAAGKSWRAIAKEVSIGLSPIMTVSYESLRQWYGSQS